MARGLLMLTLADSCPFSAHSLPQGCWLSLAKTLPSAGDCTTPRRTVEDARELVTDRCTDVQLQDTDLHTVLAWFLNLVLYRVQKHADVE